MGGLLERNFSKSLRSIDEGLIKDTTTKTYTLLELFTINSELRSFILDKNLRLTFVVIQPSLFGEKSVTPLLLRKVIQKFNHLFHAFLGYISEVGGYLV